MQKNTKEDRLKKSITTLSRLLVIMFILLAVAIAGAAYLGIFYKPEHFSFLDSKVEEQESLQGERNNVLVWSDTSSVNSDGIHVASGLIVDDKLPLILTNCTGCHSTKLISQNRATREGWKSMIEWMQKTQKLWDLGENEEPILEYLSTHYAPKKTGRRTNLTDIEWYELSE
ncbi:hypothetical protein QQ008_06650 [Fulvivirgaceae bacterium BMA10]|uniref:Monoheme cytochrome C n=1 Tax=Splendidivirga corallicola TaxID=3051826 RepID=A0ABT8KNC1_9BACT|nr:hypothetical protein [Fulvivirgaceae bacterium BMA10]